MHRDWNAAHHLWAARARVHALCSTTATFAEMPSRAMVPPSALLTSSSSWPHLCRPSLSLSPRPLASSSLSSSIRGPTPDAHERRAESLRHSKAAVEFVRSARSRERGKYRLPHRIPHRHTTLMNRQIRKRRKITASALPVESSFSAPTAPEDRMASLATSLPIPTSIRQRCTSPNTRGTTRSAPNLL
eukprot:2032511-Rhodomonas_salina.2